MKFWKMRFVALILAVALLLSGCSLTELRDGLDTIKFLLSGENAVVPFALMEYERPDLAQIRSQLDLAIQTAASEDTTVEEVVDAIYAFYDAYDWFFTCSSLADIHYSSDLTDIYWEEEYGYCLDNGSTVDAMLEELYYALALSPHRESLEAEEYFGADYFTAYEGENLWDETFVALLEQESTLQNRYYDLSTQALDYVPDSEEYYDAVAEDMAQLLVELVTLRHQIAACWGYTDYVSFANDFYYYRDFTPGEMTVYLDRIRTHLVPVYRNIQSSDWDAASIYSSEAETFRYVRTTAQNMGGMVAEAFDMLQQGRLYDIAYSPNKYNSSFEIYLTSYYEPFIFMNPTASRYDWLTFSHEFGHFCNDYASYGSYAGTDVLEVFSQGMEYLSLCYGEPDEDLARLKMADSLSVYVEQAAFAAFEQELYALSEEELTVEGLYALYDRVALDYGFDSVGYDPREFITVTHFYTNPLYVFSYIVSNDAAMQLYQLEQDTRGAGLALYEENLATQESYFLSFLQTAGLESPFAEGRIEAVRATFETFFGN